MKLNLLIINPETSEVIGQIENVQTYDLTRNMAQLDLLEDIVRIRATVGVKAEGEWK